MPPFAALVAFDAALRHGSMTLAAEELALTQSAISHRIGALERFFGVTLLERLNPGLRAPSLCATEAGARLAAELAPVLGALSGLRRRIAEPPGPRPFRLGTSASLLTCWLSARLPALCDAFPDVAIEVCSWTGAGQAARAQADLALLWVLPGEAAGGEMRFPPEVVFPVAAPSLARRVPPGGDWRSLPRLAKGRRGEEFGREWSWATWLRRPGGPEALRFPDIGTSLQAAIDGNGVALGRSLLVADALRQRRLVRVAGRREACPCSKTQVARWRDPRDRTAEAMAAWLVAAAA